LSELHKADNLAHNIEYILSMGKSGFDIRVPGPQVVTGI
jgi:hypothetical protein